MKKTKKPDFLYQVYEEVTDLLIRYQVVLSDREEDQAFKEDLITTVANRVKDSFKNGINVGMKLKEAKESK